MMDNSIWRIALAESKLEFLKVLRMPSFAIPSLGFPLAFYVLFAVVLPFAAGSEAYLVAGYGVFGVIGPALFGFGVGVSTERDQGWLLLKHASPMPPAAYILAKVGMSMMFAAIIVLEIFLVTIAFTDVSMTVWQWLALSAILIIGTIPFCAIGMAIGFMIPAQAAMAVVNLLYLPMGALAGLWFPLAIMPAIFQKIAWLLPPFHLNQLALKVVGMDSGYPWWQHVLLLAGFAIVFALIATRAYRSDQMAIAH